MRSSSPTSAARCSRRASAPSPAITWSMPASPRRWRSARAGTVAVLLPVAYYCLAAERKPPLAALRAAGAALAIASDCNPGSAPGTSLLLALSMATRLFGMTAEEALLGATREAARALGLQGQRGMLAAGQAADFVVWNIGSPAELSYWIGFNPRRTVVRAGEVLRWPNSNP